MSVSDALRAPLSLCQRLLQYQLNISNLMRADGEKDKTKTLEHTRKPCGQKNDNLENQKNRFPFALCITFFCVCKVSLKT